MKTKTRPKALLVAYACGGLPLAVGSVAFSWWWLVRSDAPILLGIGAVVVGTILVLLGLCFLVVVAITKPRPSRSAVFGAALLLSANFPIAYVYSQLVTSEITTNRYLFRNQSGSPIDNLTVIHQHRQIGFCRRLDENRSVEFSFSALNNGGEGAISFTGQQGPRRLGGETGLMAFVFTKSHAEIILLPNGKYQTRIQEFKMGSPLGKLQQTDWESIHEPPSKPD